MINIFNWQSGLKTCVRTDFFTAIIICINKKYFLFCDRVWKENIIQCILSAKLSAPQIFLFDGQAWKHDSTQIVITAVIKCLKITSTTKWQLLKICYLRQRLRIFLFRRKAMFHSQDIQVFVFLATPWFTKSVTPWWVLVN